MKNKFHIADITRHEEHLHVTRRSLLFYRDFRRFVSGQFLSQVADAASSVTAARYLLFNSTDGPTVTRLVQTVLSAAVPLLIAGPIAGAIADRFSRRTILCVGQLFRAAFVVAMLISTALNLRIVSLVLFGSALCLTRILYTARSASIRHLVRQHELVAADSLVLSLSALAGGIGASVAVGFTQLIETNTFIIVAILHLLACGYFRRIDLILGGGREHVSASWRASITHLRFPKTRFAIAATSTHRFLFGITFSTTALILDAHSSGSATTYASALGACGTGAFLGTLTAEWMNEHFPRRTITMITFVISSIATMAGIVDGSSTVRLVGLCITMFCFQNLRVCSDATVQSNATQGAGGRIFAAYDMAYNIAFLAGIIVGLSATKVLAPVTTIWAMVSCFAVATGVFALMPREVEREKLNTSAEFSGIDSLPNIVHF